jgi:serine/threonine-protein kinase
LPSWSGALAKSVVERFTSAKEFATALRNPDDPTLVRTIVAPVRGPQFDPEFLATLGRDLATHLGPIAATLVRRAAGSARDRDSLCRSLAEHLDEPEQRYPFLRRNSPGKHAALPVTQARVPSAAVHAQVALSAESIAAAQALLVAEMGPIAALIVRKAAATAATKNGFLDDLAAQAPIVGTLRRRLQEAMRRGHGDT